MTGVILCNKVDGKSQRTRLEGITANTTVKELKTKAAQQISLNNCEFELVYAGQYLHNEEDEVQAYGITSGVTVYALKSLTDNNHPMEPEPMDDASIQQVVTALQAAMINPAYRNIVEKMVTNQETMENLIAATPGLEHDPVAIAMLQDSQLLALMADPDHVKQVIEAHPCLGQAALYVAAAVNEESTKAGAAGVSGSGTYSLDRMSDDEDGMEVIRPQRTGENQPITASQLAAALQAATGGLSSQPSTSSSQSRGSRPDQGVTMDFFQQAMAQAQSQASSSSSSSSQGTRPNLDAQLQQMRDMGITDEAVARQALEAAGGNVMAALEFIFGDGSL